MSRNLRAVYSSVTVCAIQAREDTSLHVFAEFPSVAGQWRQTFRGQFRLKSRCQHPVPRSVQAQRKAVLSAQSKADGEIALVDKLCEGMTSERDGKNEKY